MCVSEATLPHSAVKSNHLACCQVLSRGGNNLTSSSMLSVASPPSRLSRPARRRQGRRSDLTTAKPPLASLPGRSLPGSPVSLLQARHCLWLNCGPCTMWAQPGFRPPASAGKLPRVSLSCRSPLKAEFLPLSSSGPLSPLFIRTKKLWQNTTEQTTGSSCRC